MKINLSNVTCKDERNYNNLISYMARVSRYKNFDESQMMNVYVDNECDLIGFDSQKYRIQFVNNSHKLSEVVQTIAFIDPVPYSALRDAVLKMGSGSKDNLAYTPF